jgi:hypothetical protein
MKEIIIVLIALNLFCSCRIIETDDVGKSDFIIENKTTDIIYLDLKLHVNYQSLNDTILSIDNNSKKVVFNEVWGDIGTHALPSEIFKLIRAFSDIHLSNEIYVLDHVYDSLWLHETPSGFPYWEYAIYTLEITDQLIN